MTVLTSAQYNLANTHPQQSMLYLSIYEPQIALKCRVNGAYDASTQTVNYDGVSTGTYTAIADYMFQVALIGTTEGGDEKGRTWVRSATASSIRFVESTHINWNDDDYITVLKYTEIIPVLPRIIQNPSNEEDVIFYKIWDIPYTNQNSILGTFINMGPHHAGFLDGGSMQVYYSASGTSNLLGETLTYSWMFEGATVTGSSNHTPGNVTYTTPGFYRTILTVTSTSGRVDKSVRCVSVYNRPNAGTVVPITQFTLSSFNGNRSGGGYSTQVKVMENIDRSKIKDGALVVIFGEDWYGNTKQSFGGNALNRSSIKLVGYINQETIQYDYRSGYVEFEILSPTKLMDITECYSVSVESKTSPSTWFELLNMTVSRALYHYYAWHSTVLLCCDFEYHCDDEFRHYFDADRESLYKAGNTLMQGTMKGRLICDRQGKIWAERDADVINSLGSVVPNTLEIDKHDWMERPTIRRNIYKETAFIEMGGVAYNASPDSYQAVLANAPNVRPAYHGKVERIQGLSFTSQAQLNTMIGNVLEARNAEFPEVEYKLRSAWWNLDIVPMETVSVTLDNQESNSGFVWSNKKFVVQGITWNCDSKALVTIPSINVSEVTQGFDGVTVVIPPVPPSEGSGGGSFSPVPYTPTTTTVSSVTGSITGLYVKDDHVLQGSGTVTILDFIGSMVQASVTGTTAYILPYIPIYHNDIFVGNARALNFLDYNYSSSGT
jgi:hypothetical protein